MPNENKFEGCGRLLWMLAILSSLTLAALRADGVIEWAWYWLLLPLAVATFLGLFAALVAALSLEMKS